MKPSIYQVDCETAGALYVMPKPSGDWLEDDLMAYKAIGVDKIVSLLTFDEIEELGLQNEQTSCGIHGMGYAQFSIVD